MTCNNIIFVHEDPKETVSLIGQSKIPLIGPKPSSILCYPRHDAFDVKISSSRGIHIDEIRCLEIDCINGPSVIENAELKLKSASSGLRLQRPDASVTMGDPQISAKASPGLIVIRSLEPLSKVRIKIPYELDDNHQDISIKIDVVSKSSNLEYSSIESVRVELPLDV